MAKRRGGANPKLDRAEEAACRAIAAHERSLKARKREVEAAGHQPPATRRHLCLMLAKHHEGLAKEYRALAREQGELRRLFGAWLVPHLPPTGLTQPPE